MPSEEALTRCDATALKSAIADSLKDAARAAGLQSYEVPRDFLIETAPFTLENGLLTGIRKLAWPKLKEHYGPALEQLYVDWLVDAGYPIVKVTDYASWLSRFETTLRALPDKQRQAYLLPLIHNYQQPEHPMRGSIAPTEHFRAAVQEAKIGPDKDIPHITASAPVFYV